MKKVVIFGAAGKTGYLIVEQALSAGHQVTAAMRRPEVFTLNHPNLRSLRSDIFDIASVEDALIGQEVVICAIAAPLSQDPTDIQAFSARTLLTSMAKVGITRFLGITSGGTNPKHDPNLPVVFEQVFKRMFHAIYDDQIAMESVVMASASAWTIVRPAQLTDGPRTGVYRLAAHYSLPHGTQISRADVADFLVKQVESSAYVRQGVAIAY